MKMVKNIDRMIESVIEREDLMRELAEQESYDDVYDFCTSIEDGYTQEELFGFLDEAYENYGHAIPEIENNVLDYVAGGKGDFRGKIMAGVLSSLALFPASAVGASALNQDSSKVSSESSASSVENKKGIKAGVKALSAMCNYKYSKDKSSISKDELLDKMFDKLRLTEDTKSQLKKVMVSIYNERIKYSQEGKVYDHGDVIYVDGPGLSNKADALKAAFVLERPCVYSFSDMDSGSEKSKVEQIFGPTSEDKKSKGNVFSYIKNLFNKSDKHKSLYSYIKSHPGFGCVILKDYDNLRDKDVDEALEKIIDTGKITVSGEEIDCSGITFILTTDSGKYSNLHFGKKINHKLSGCCDSSFLNKLKIVDFDRTAERKVRNCIESVTRECFLQRYTSDVEINVILSDEEVNKIVEKEGLKNDNYDEFTYNHSLEYKIRRALYGILYKDYGLEKMGKIKAQNKINIEFKCELKEYSSTEMELEEKFIPNGVVEVDGKKMYWGITATIKD